MIVGFDLGTTTGFALAMQGGAKASGRQSFKPKPHENREMRFQLFERFLNDLHAIEPITLIAYELVRRHRGVQAAHVYGGFIAKLGEWCALNNVALSGVEVQYVKIQVTGKGNATKRQMIDGVSDKYGVICVDDNEADAVGVREYALEHLA